MDERRQLPRWEMRREAKMWIPYLQDFSHCTIEDMHMKGMRVSFKKRIFINQTVSVSLDIGNDSQLIKIDAHIPWREEGENNYVYGMSFSHIVDSDKEKLYRYITSNCLDQFKNKWWDGISCAKIPGPENPRSIQ